MALLHPRISQVAPSRIVDHSRAIPGASSCSSACSDVPSGAPVWT